MCFLLGVRKKVTPCLTSQDHPTSVTVFFVCWAHSAITWSYEGEQKVFRFDLEWVGIQGTALAF